MNSYRKVRSATLYVTTVAILFCISATAQGPADLSAQNQATATTPSDPPQQKAASDDPWKFDIAPYVWIPGVHGTARALGRDASVHVSGSNLLSNFNGGLAGFFQARKNRWVIPIDFIWTKLATTQAFPLDVLTYLVQQQGVDPDRVEVRQGAGQSQVADIIWVPQGVNASACADLQNTTPVDESSVKPSENAYPKPRTEAPMRRHHAASGSTQQ